MGEKKGKRRPNPLMKTIRPTEVFESYFLGLILLFTSGTEQLGEGGGGVIMK